MRIVNLIKLFLNRRYKTISINQHFLKIDIDFDIGIREYYKYVTQLILDTIFNLPRQSPSYTFQLGISEEDNIKNQFFKSIAFQIEHTLVKPGGRGSESAPMGKTPIKNSINSFYTVRIQNLNHLLKQDLIIEYSRPNIKNIQDCSFYMDYLKKVCLLTPTMYPINEALIMNQQRSVNTMTLFRDTTQLRRKKFLKDLDAANVNYKNMNHVFSNLDKLYFDTKILINIHQTDHHDTLEELRILPALRCGVIVISEESPLKKYSRYSDFIIWGKLEELPKIILDVQENYAKYHQKLFNRIFFTRMKRLEKSNQIRCHLSLSGLLK